jgi:arylsulfate sulfotransferase
MISRRRQVLIGLVAAILIPASIYVSGILVKPNIFTVDKLVEVPDYDVLEWQHFREQQLLAEGAVSTYTDPFVMIDPYAMNPLSAIVLFKADQAATYTITVDAPNDYAKLVTRVDREAGIVALPIIGLYPQTANTVIINNGQDEVILTITTDRLPRDFQDVQRIASSPERMQPGFTLFVACFDHSYTALIDQDGAVRGYFSNTSMAHGTSVITLSNGHLLSTGR